MSGFEAWLRENKNRPVNNLDSSEIGFYADQYASECRREGIEQGSKEIDGGFYGRMASSLQQDNRLLRSILVEVKSAVDLDKEMSSIVDETLAKSFSFKLI